MYIVACNINIAELQLIFSFLPKRGGKNAVYFWFLEHHGFFMETVFHVT